MGDDGKDVEERGLDESGLNGIKENGNAVR